METIELEGSPAQLIAADAGVDNEDDDQPVRLHEPADDEAEDEAEQAPPAPEQLSPEQFLLVSFSKF